MKPVTDLQFRQSRPAQAATAAQDALAALEQCFAYYAPQPRPAGPSAAADPSQAAEAELFAYYRAA